MPTAQRTRDRGCPACGETITSYPCGNCTWEPGLKVVQRTETPEGTEYTFVQERRSKFRAMAGFLALVLGVMLVAYAISGAGGGGGIALGVIFGPLVFAAGIMTIKLTRAGKVWWGLSSQEKAIAVPGLIAGTFMGVIVFWAVLGAWFIWSLSAGTARDVMRQV